MHTSVAIRPQYQPASGSEGMRAHVLNVHVWKLYFFTTLTTAGLLQPFLTLTRMLMGSGRDQGAIPGWSQYPLWDFRLRATEKN